MTRILPIYGANLAHYSRPRREERHERANAGAERTAQETRHHGNRRMGDRRQADRRAQGRRATDHVARKDTQVWLSADFGAHLIGQAYALPAIDRQQAVKAYVQTPNTNPFRKGGLI